MVDPAGDIEEHQHGPPGPNQKQAVAGRVGGNGTVTAVPEAAEVHIAASQLDWLVAGRPITDVEIRHTRASRAQSTLDLERSLRGRVVTSATRSGKWIVVSFADTGPQVGIHLRMSGLLLDGTTREPSRHDQIELTFGHRRTQGPIPPGVPSPPPAAHDQDTAHVVFHDPRTFGEFKVLWDPLDIAGDLDAPGLGTTGAEELARRRPKMAVKALLIDQHAWCSGIGSYLADEVLHILRINPRRPIGELDEADWAAVLATTRAVVVKSAAVGGCTLADEGWVDLWGRPGRYARWLRVHARERCATCCADTTSARIAGRSARWCEYCQPD